MDLYKGLIVARFTLEESMQYCIMQSIVVQWLICVLRIQSILVMWKIYDFQEYFYKSIRNWAFRDFISILLCFY